MKVSEWKIGTLLQKKWHSSGVLVRKALMCLIRGEIHFLCVYNCETQMELRGILLITLLSNLKPNLSEIGNYSIFKSPQKRCFHNLFIQVSFGKED